MGIDNKAIASYLISLYGSVIFVTARRLTRPAAWPIAPCSH